MNGRTRRPAPGRGSSSSTISNGTPGKRALTDGFTRRSGPLWGAPPSQPALGLDADGDGSEAAGPEADGSGGSNGGARADKAIIGDETSNPEAGGKKKKPDKKADKATADAIAALIDTTEGMLADLHEMVNVLADGGDNLILVQLQGKSVRVQINGLKGLDSKLTNAQRLRVHQLEDDLDEQALKAAPFFQEADPGDGSSESSEGEESDTEATEATETGFPLVDKGYACEQEEHANDPGCTLTSTQRRDLGGILQSRMLHALINYQTAIQNARIAELTTTEHGWGFLAEFLFYSVSGVLIGSMMGALAKFVALDAEKLAALGLPDKAIKAFQNQKIVDGLTTVTKDVLTNSSRGVRGVLKAKANGLGDGATGHAAFLEIIQNSATMISEQAGEEAPVTMNDEQLVQFTAAYAIANGNHTVPFYRAQVDDVIAKYDRYHVGGIDAPKTGEDSFHIAKLTAWGQTKTAVLRYNGGYKTGDGPRQFVRFVDPDFAGFVEGVAVDRKAMFEFDVTVNNDISDSFLAPDEYVNPDAETTADKFEANNNAEFAAWRSQCKKEYYDKAQANDDARKEKEGDGPDPDREREVAGGFTP